MEIHVVQTGDTLQSIAELYGVSANQLIIDNGITHPNNLRPGQSIVIAKPERTHIVREGDSLQAIADTYNVSVIQLLANNPYLSNREFLFPGDEIIISFQRKRTITTHGNTAPYISKEALTKTLPYLTYLSILNYTATQDGDIQTYYDDTELIQTTLAYGVAPLMLLTTLTIQGEAKIRTDYDLLLNNEFQDKQIDNILAILKTKGFMGLNLSFQFINVSNVLLYRDYLMKVSTRLNAEGYPVFVTINPNITETSAGVQFERIDYSYFNQISDSMIFMTYEWASQRNPPSAISSIYRANLFLNHVLNYIPSDKIILGIATIGYDWELPYVPGVSNINVISYERFIDFAENFGAEIRFDEASQSPYFTYTSGMVDHIVWFIDAKSINASLDLVIKYNLKGISIWNITIYNPQLWLLINSQFEIEKVL